MGNKKQKSELSANTQRREFLKKGALAFGSITILPSHVLFARPELKNKAGEIIEEHL